MRKRKILLTVLYLFFIINGIFSQYYYRGIIKDKDNLFPLSFVNIKYNNALTATDINGYFNIVTNSDTLTLTISYIGYKPKVINYSAKAKVNVLKDILLELEPKNLDEITITSGKYKKSINEITVSMETIKPKFIQNNNITVFNNLLDKIPGVNIIDGQVNIRGGSGFSYGAGSRVMVLINNMPALQFDSALPNWENIPVETIEKIEIMKGAGSALYGSAAMNGVINILPVYAKKKPLFRVKTFYTVYDSPKDINKKWWKGDISSIRAGLTKEFSFVLVKTDTFPYRAGISGVFAKKFNKLDVVSSFYLNRTDGYNRYTFDNYGRFTINLEYHFSDRFKIGLNTNINSGKGLTFFYWKNAQSGAYQADTVAYSAKDKDVIIIDPSISYNSKNGGKHKLQGRIYSVSNLIGIDKYDKSKTYYGEYQFQKKISDLDIILTAGTVFSKSITNAELYGDTIFVANNSAIYLQLEKKLWNRLNLVLGIRNETNNIKGPKIINKKDVSDKYDFESNPIFRFGSNYKLFDKTNLRASWGQGVRYPTIAEKFSNAFEGDLVLLPNLDLKPETGYTAEFGIRQGWRLAGVKGYADISAFQSEYKNMIEFALQFDNGIYFTSVNLANTIIKGIELTTGFSGKIKDIELNFNGGYTYIDPKYKEFTDDIKGKSSVDYNVLKYRYKKTYKFDAEIKYKGINLGFGSAYNSFMEAIDKLFELNFEGLPKGIKEYRATHNQGTNIYRMRIGYNFKKIGVQLNIDNLFNKEYSVRPGLMAAPRSFTLSLSYEL